MDESDYRRRKAMTRKDAYTEYEKCAVERLKAQTQATAGSQRAFGILQG